MTSQVKQTESKDPLFREYKSSTCILLVDASASTKSPFVKNQTIFNKFMDVVKTLGHQDYRILTWNSKNSNEKYPEGSYVIPFAVKAATLSSTFMMLENTINGPCLTCPHLGFNAIPEQWFQNHPTVYLVTDGEIGWGGITPYEKLELKNQLAKSIRELSNKRVRFCIITVENSERDFNKVEVNAAGNDVYNVISEQKLTNMVDQFVSYTPSGRFVQINKNKPDLPGYIPYEEKSFSEFRTHEFMMFIRDELKTKPDEESQIRIAQNLSSTLDYLTKDKPKHVANDIVKTFSNLFSIDQNLIRFILTEAIEKERAGNAGLYSNYRSQLKNLFAQAEQKLKEDVRSAVNIQDNFITYPINGRVLSGNGRLMDKSLVINKIRYPSCAFYNLPCFALDGKLNDLQEQCLRQWTRTVFAQMYNTNMQSDEIIYLVLTTVFIVTNSPSIPDFVKTAYQNLGTVMLKKKRLNTVNLTELEFLESGSLPIPNSGKIEDFFKYMKTCSSKLNVQCLPMKLWYEICKSMGGKLFSSQKDICMNHAEYSDALIFQEYHHDVIPDEVAYDYKCIITLDDISNVGGYRILPHKNAGDYQCSPVYLLSHEGKESLLKSANCVCPICYSRLNAGTFEEVGKKIPFELPASYQNQIFTDTLINNESKNDYKNEVVSNSQQVFKTGTLVILRGTVGSGKSTYAKAAKNFVESRGGIAYVANTDRYCSQGMSVPDAVQNLEKEIIAFASNDNPDKVIIVDVCNENYGKKQTKFFNVNLDTWKQVVVFPNLQKDAGGKFVNLDGYLSWSLYNVLKRNIPGPNDTHWLNPVSASEQICKDVHKKKSTVLFGGKVWKLSGGTSSNLEEQANEYAKTLSEFVFPF
jgi:hypothetical protein